MDSKLGLGSLALVAAIAGGATATPTSTTPPTPKAAAQPADGDALYDIDTAAQKAPAANSALDHILGSLRLRICVRSDVAPFGYFASTGLEGFDIELASELAKQISIDYKQPLRTEWTVVATAIL